MQIITTAQLVSDTDDLLEMLNENQLPVAIINKSETRAIMQNFATYQKTQAEIKLLISALQDDSTSDAFRL